MQVQEPAVFFSSFIAPFCSHDACLAFEMLCLSHVLLQWRHLGAVLHWEPVELLPDCKTQINPQ